MKKSSVRESCFYPTKAEITQYYIISYIGIFLLCLLFYKSLFISFVVGLLCFVGVKRYVNFVIFRKKALVLKEFNDFLYSISSSFELGVNLVTALETAEKNLDFIYKGKGILGKEIKITRLEIINGNQREEKALLNFAERVPLEDINNFVEVYIFCKKVGGNLNNIILKSIRIITEKIMIEREIESVMSQKKFEGQIILLMPILTVFLLNVFSPTYLESLYTTGIGRVIMTVSLGGIGVAFFIMENLTKIEI